MAVGFFRRLFGRRSKDETPEEQSSGEGASDDTGAEGGVPEDGDDAPERTSDGAARESQGDLGDLAPDAQYCRVGLESFPIGDGEEVVRARTGASMRASLHDSDLLRRCERFMTLDAHARALCADLDSGESMLDEVAETLSMFARAGLMHRRDALLCETRARAEHEPLPPPITRLVIGTRDRVDLAIRAVQTYATSIRKPGSQDSEHAGDPASDHDSDHDGDHDGGEASQEAGAPLEITILDDAADDRARRTLQHALTPLMQAAGDELSIRYAGPDQRRAFAAHLDEAAGGALRAIIDFALFGVPESDWHPGANRNAALLHGAGSMLVWADDDTRCPLARRPERRPGLRLSARRDPTDLWLHEDAARVHEAVEHEEHDVLAAHEALLGKRLGQCLGLLADTAVDLDQAPPEVLDQIAAGHGQVLVTATGVAGDLGLTSPHAYLLLEGAPRRRLLADYQRLRTTRYGVRGVDRATLSLASAFPAQCMGLDHRQLLPPFFPFGRGHEDVFAALLRVCREDAYVGHLPWLVQHAPGARPALDREGLFAPAAGMATSMHALLAIATHTPTRALPAHALDAPAHRLAAAGRHLQMIAALRPGEYRDFIREHHMRVAGEHIEALHQTRMRHQDETGAHAEAWAEDVLEHIERWRDLVTSDDWGAPRDLLDAGLAPDQAWAAAQDAIGRFGQLVEAWPRLVSAARSLADAGRPLAVSLDEVTP